MTTRGIVICGLTGSLAIVAGWVLLQKSVPTTQKSDTSPSRPIPVRVTEPPPPVLVSVATNPSSPAPALPVTTDTTRKNRERLTIKLPGPVFIGTPPDVRRANLEPSREGKLRDPLDVPKGTRLLSLGCKVTSSDPSPLIGELANITDGDKEHDSTTCVELGINTQWVQLDLGTEKEIYAACVWHCHGEARVYNDVICQISNDPDFIDRVETVFNNDHDDTSKLGIGRDKEYFETNEGRPFAVNGVKGRYVRFYSRGNSSNTGNHYTEIEIYGKDI